MAGKNLSKYIFGWLVAFVSTIASASDIQYNDIMVMSDQFKTKSSISNFFDNSITENNLDLETSSKIKSRSIKQLFENEDKILLSDLKIYLSALDHEKGETLVIGTFLSDVTTWIDMTRENRVRLSEISHNKKMIESLVLMSNIKDLKLSMRGEPLCNRLKNKLLWQCSWVQDFSDYSSNSVVSHRFNVEYDQFNKIVTKDSSIHKTSD